MSRGWEVKSVQGMMDDHDNRSMHREPERTPEQIAVEKKRYGLELSRKGVLNDLAKATNPRHRAQLEAALRHLDGRLEAADAEGKAGLCEGNSENKETDQGNE